MLIRLADALAQGMTRVDVAREVRQGSWLRQERGVFVPREAWEQLDERGRHLLQARARLTVLGPGWALARRTAALGFGLQQLGRPPEVPQLLGAKGRAKARSRHVRIATLPDEDVVVLEGFRTTRLERTMVDVCRRESFRSAVVLADSALRNGADLELARAVGRRCQGWPGGLAVEPVLRFADGRSESALESVSRVGMLDARLLMPEQQVEVYLGGRLLGRVDFLWRRFNLVGECDGLVKYTDTDVVVREKLREEALRAAGLEVVRWNWSHAWERRGADLADRIRHGMVLGAARVLDPRVRYAATAVPARFPATG